MLERIQPTIIPRTHVVNTLSTLRQEWEQAANGHSLLELDANVGLLLWDMVMSIGLTPPEQMQVFGADLAHKLEDTLTHPGN